MEFIIVSQQVCSFLHKVKITEGIEGDGKDIYAPNPFRGGVEGDPVGGVEVDG